MKEDPAGFLDVLAVGVEGKRGAYVVPGFCLSSCKSSRPGHTMAMGRPAKGGPAKGGPGGEAQWR